MNAQAFKIYGDADDSPANHARVDMLLEIDFKWLMAGQGWRVDPERLKNDPSYANACLQFALESGNDSLQNCADCLRAELGAGPVVSDGPACAPARGSSAPSRRY